MIKDSGGSPTSIGDRAVARGDKAEKRLAAYEENVGYLLDHTTKAVRVCQGGGPEDLLESLCLNYICLRDEAGRRKP